jgi:hypothetical protein
MVGFGAKRQNVLDNLSMQHLALAQGLLLPLLQTQKDWFSSCVVPNVAKKSLSGINPTGL